jgi:DNA-binding protein H-NS
MFARKPPPTFPDHPPTPPQPVLTEKSIHDLSLPDLKAFHEHVGAILAERTAQAREDFRQDFLSKLELFGMSLDDFKPEPPKKERKTRDLKPKYRHPTVTDWTWHGVGRQPQWVKELLDQGHSLEEFLIDGAPPPAAGPLS